MANENRTLTRSMLLRLSDAEYGEVKAKIESSGLSQQDYLYQAVVNGVIVNPDTKATQDYFTALKKLEKDINGATNNLNQIARSMNTYKDKFEFSDFFEFGELKKSFYYFRKEAIKLCQSSKTVLDAMAGIIHRNR